MGRKYLKTIYKPKCLQNIPRHKEEHHTCLNSSICTKEISPCARCEGCKYYKLQEVDVADRETRFSLDWGF